MITNNSYVDGVVHRKMREHLRRTFNTIYIINLHGDSNKQEKTAEGKPDKNVFDIKQGVAIIIAIKRNDSAELANVFIKDLWGTRDQKYEWLWQSSIQPDDFVEAEYQHEYNFFTAKPFRSGDIYNQGFCISEFFTRGLSGIKFRKDNLLITHNFTRADAIRMVNDVCELKDSEILYKYNFKETADWKIEDQRKNFINFIDSDIIRVTYRPLDFRYTYYPFDRINKIIPRGDSRRGLMKHMLTGSNIALIAGGRTSPV